MKIKSRVIVIGMMTTLILLGSSLFAVSAQCTPSNTGDAGDNVINCDATNDPAGASVNGLDGNDTINNGAGATANSLNGNNDNDTITNSGTANNINAGNNDDTVINNGTVNNDINGNDGTNNITNNGNVGNNINGGTGNDTIVNSGEVQRSINGGGNSGSDNITNNGTVQTNINAGEGDDTVANNGTVQVDVTLDTGNDEFTNNGAVEGSVFANSGDDTVIIGENGTVGGTIDGGPDTDTLRFEMLLCELEDGDFSTINTQIENSNASGDNITINGSTYVWVNFEILEGAIEQDIPDNCVEAEFYGFTDGRLNGLQCQIWLLDGTMELYNYQGIDGILVSESDLVASPAVNTLLASNTTNTVRVYQLTSGEIQVQCDVWDTFLNDWKTDNYIFQDFFDNQPAVIR